VIECDEADDEAWIVRSTPVVEAVEDW